jgi:hypothetical protein
MDRFQSTRDVVRLQTLEAIWTTNVNVDRHGTSGDRGSSLFRLLLGRDRDGRMLRSRPASVYRGLDQHRLLQLAG